MRKTFLVLILFMTSHLYARDCFLETLQLKVGLKVTGILNDILYMHESKKVSFMSICERRGGMWDDERRELQEAFINLRQDFKKKGDLVSQCEKLEKQIVKETSCYLPKSFLEEIKEKNFTEMTLEDLCESYLPRLKKIYHSCPK
jgi:hypothetical protein